MEASNVATPPWTQLATAKACRALTRCLEPSGSREPLDQCEASALLAALWLPHHSQGALAPETTAACAVRLCSLQLLRVGAARVEKEHAAAVALGTSGVHVAVQAIVEARLGDRAEGKGDEQATMIYRLRMGVEAAAALADLVAGAGANKALTLELGGVDALLGCVEQHVACMATPGPAGTPNDTEENLRRLVGELCLQACRALGNLCYGWDVDAIKAA
eukprot:6125135-Prymnesium_polylepis.1